MNKLGRLSLLAQQLILCLLRWLLLFGLGLVHRLVRHHSRLQFFIDYSEFLILLLESLAPRLQARMSRLKFMEQFLRFLQMNACNLKFELVCLSGVCQFLLQVPDGLRFLIDLGF